MSLSMYKIVVAVSFQLKYNRCRNFSGHLSVVDLVSAIKYCHKLLVMIDLISVVKYSYIQNYTYCSTLY